MEKKLTPKQEKFVEVYVKNGGDHQQAAIEAGYSVATALEQGCALRKRLSAQIADRTRHEMGYLAPKALANVAKIAGDSSNEMAKLKASTDILDRAGFKPVDKVEDVTPKSEGTDIIKMLQKDLAGMLPKIWPTLPPETQDQCLRAMGIDPESIKELPRAQVIELHHNAA